MKRRPDSTLVLTLACAAVFLAFAIEARCEPPARVTWHSAEQAAAEFEAQSAGGLTPFVVAYSPNGAMDLAGEVARLRAENAALREEAEAARAVVESMSAELKIARDLRDLDGSLTVKIDEFTKAEKRLAQTKAPRWVVGLAAFAGGALTGVAVSR